MKLLAAGRLQATRRLGLVAVPAGAGVEVVVLVHGLVGGQVVLDAVPAAPEPPRQGPHASRDALANVPGLVPPAAGLVPARVPGVRPPVCPLPSFSYYSVRQFCSRLFRWERRAACHTIRRDHDDSKNTDKKKIHDQ